MLTSINEARGQVAPSMEAALLMAKTAYGSHASQSSWQPLAKARNVSPSTPLARSALALVFLR